MTWWMGLALTAGLLALNAVFVAAEFALISARRTRLEPLAREGSRSARLALRAMGDVSVAMAAAQLGITICSLLLGAVSEPAIAHLIEPGLKALGAPEGAVHPVAFALALTLVVGLHVVLGEMVPKNLALAGPEAVARALAPVMLAVVLVLRPVIVLLNGTASLVLRAVRIRQVDEVASTFTSDEVAGLVEESRREGLLDDDEYGLVSGALGFGGGTVARVLLPRESLVTITTGSTPAEVEQACASTGYSRFPVADAAGDLVGYLHIKDVLETDERSRVAPVPDKWVRPLATVSPGTGLLEALQVMRARGAHLARVAEADGTVLGVVLLEDVLAELVGEVRG